MSQGFNIISSLVLDTSQFKGAMKQAGDAVKKSSKKSVLDIARMTLAFDATRAAVRLVIGAFESFISTIMEFSKAMSELKGVLGGSAEEMEELSQQAQDLGGSTVHTATEVVKLQTALARLGFAQPEIIAMTESILHLGTAMGVSLDDAANLVGSTLRAFKLEAEDATRVTDILTNATISSSLTFAKLKIALPYASTAAKDFGVSIETTAKLLGELSNRGLRASTMGTGMRKIFITLSRKGLDFNTVMKEINESTNKADASYKHFGLTAVNAGIILAESGVQINSLTGKVEDLTDTTQDLADTMADNLSGDITLAKSAWQGFITAVDDGKGIFAQSLRSMTKSTADFFNLLKTWAEGGSISDYIAKGIADSPEFRKNLGVAKKAIEDNYEDVLTSAEGINKLLAENVETQKKINELENEFVVFASGEEEMDKRVASLKANIIGNNELIVTIGKVINKKAELKKTSSLLTEAEKEELAAAEKLKEKMEESLPVYDKLMDKYYLMTLSGQAYKDEELAQWYETEKKKLDALTIGVIQRNIAETMLVTILESKLKILKDLADLEKEQKEGETTWDPNDTGDDYGTSWDAGTTDDDTFTGGWDKELVTINDLLEATVKQANLVSDAFDILGDAISGAIEGQDDVFANMAVGVLKSINKIINGLIAQMIATLMAGGAVKGIGGLIAAAVAVPIAIGFINKSISKNKANFAEGGIVPGTSFSGDKVLAGLNSGEMILNKVQQAELFKIANGGGVDSAGGNVEFKIRGEALVGVLKNQNIKVKNMH